VEVDYTTRITTVTFNSDQLQFLKVDIEALKEELKIDAKQFRYDYGPKVTVSFNGVKSSFYAGQGGQGGDSSSDGSGSPNGQGGDGSGQSNPYAIFQPPTLQDFRSRQTGQGLQNWAHSGNSGGK
jgi:hypothetical protein